MKKFFGFILAVFTILSLFSCRKGKSDDKTILIGASPVPHAQILKVIEEDAKNDGYVLKVREFSDYVTPNEALEAGEIDANFFQHKPYMDSFNKERGFHLVSVLGVHIEPMALFSSKIRKLNNVRVNGLTVAIPNDPTNEARALMLLESAELIKLANGANILATVDDVVSNPYDLTIKTIEAASLPRMLADVDMAVINGNYALSSGLDINKDALFVENANSPYVNIITVKQGNEDSAKTAEIVKLLKSDKVREYIRKTYPNGEVKSVL